MPAFDLSRSALDEQVPKDPLDYAVSVRDRDVMRMVRDALAQDHCALAFQPVVLAAQGGNTAFYEGLIRVLDDTGRVIPAAQFMGKVEDDTIGRDIDCASLALGFDRLREVPGLRLAVNVSARSLGDGTWRRVLERNLHDDPDLGHRLILEISEESAMQLPEVVIRFMEEMQPRGVAFGLDDFGAGLTAFRYLKDFFFDLVKIDSCFVRGIDQDPDNQVIAEALITIAHQFEMFAVAEGVETRAEAAMLARFGVDCLQGYLYGVPRFRI
ncbi:MAG: EAL domain-containing protein [Alphaproteobacteria bacterium]|jgi:EAL domain-containing protein (putative c-di-GMP-specific phosphodiesterase class I)|nr:EAL domain-containing protein [Alphaproteobacteria bacterium]